MCGSGGVRWCWCFVEKSGGGVSGYGARWWCVMVANDAW